MEAKLSRSLQEMELPKLVRLAHYVARVLSQTSAPALPEGEHAEASRIVTALKDDPKGGVVELEQLVRARTQAEIGEGRGGVTAVERIRAVGLPGAEPR
jgi:hypothetical protein